MKYDKLRVNEAFAPRNSAYFAATRCGVAPSF